MVQSAHGPHDLPAMLVLGVDTGALRAGAVLVETVGPRLVCAWRLEATKALAIPQRLLEVSAWARSVAEQARSRGARVAHVELPMISPGGIAAQQVFCALGVTIEALAAQELEVRLLMARTVRSQHRAIVPRDWPGPASKRRAEGKRRVGVALRLLLGAAAETLSEDERDAALTALSRPAATGPIYRPKQKLLPLRPAVTRRPSRRPAAEG